MKNIMKIFILFLSFGFVISANAQCSSIHSNFNDVKSFLTDSDVNRRGFNLQVTIVNPGRNNGASHRYTSFGKISHIDSNFNCNSDRYLEVGQALILFSDRASFTGNKDRQTYRFDLRNNSVRVTLNTWGNNSFTIYNLVKRGRLIYGFKSSGEMYVFDFVQVSGLI